MLSFVLNYTHSVINALFRNIKIEHEASAKGDTKQSCFHADNRPRQNLIKNLQTTTQTPETSNLEMAFFKNEKLFLQLKNFLFRKKFPAAKLTKRKPYEQRKLTH